MAPKPLVDRSFENLRKLIRKKAQQQRRANVHLAGLDKPRPAPTGADSDTHIFEAAMADVVPLNRNNCRARAKAPSKACRPQKADPDREVLRRLERLVKTGAGFVVSQTPEYVQGTAPDIHPRVIDLILAGHFSIQDTLNLRGMHLMEAQTAFDLFMERALRNDHRLVLVVHGRGLSSPGEPVLKTNLIRWLTRGKWRKRTLAFCSARHFDGGAGATYVLLRRIP